MGEVKVAKNIGDLDEILLEGISPIQALRRSMGVYSFPLYIRNKNRGLSAHEADIVFCYTGAELNLEVFLKEEILAAGSVVIPKTDVVNLLSKTVLALDHKPQPDSPERITVVSMDTVAFTNPLVSFDNLQLQYCGQGVFLPMEIIESLKTEKPKSEVKLGYHIINPGDDLPTKIAKFFVNLELEGLYKDGKLMFNDREFALNEFLNRNDSATAMALAPDVVGQRERQVREMVDMGEKVVGKYHPIVILYHLRLPAGRSFATPEAVSKALYVDSAGIEQYASLGKIEKSSIGISKRSVMKAQAELYHEIWQWLAQQNYRVPVLAEKESPGQENPQRARNYNQRIAGKTFVSIAQRESSGAYSFPLILAGRYMPISTLGKIVIKQGNILVYTDNGLIAKTPLGQIVIPERGCELQISYRCNTTKTTIEIVEVSAAMLNQRDAVETVRVQGAVVSPASLQQVASSGPPQGVSPPHKILGQPPAAPPPRDVRPPHHDSSPRAPPSVQQAASQPRLEERITGREAIQRACGMTTDEFGLYRADLKDAKLFYQDERGAWYIRKADVGSIKIHLGKSKGITEGGRQAGTSYQDINSRQGVGGAMATPNIYVSAVELLVDNGTITRRTGVNELEGMLKREYSLEPTNSSVLLAYAKQLVEIKHAPHSKRRVPYQEALGMLGCELGQNEETAIATLADTLKITGSDIISENLLRYIAKEKFLRDNPRFKPSQS